MISFDKKQLAWAEAKDGYVEDWNSEIEVSL